MDTYENFVSIETLEKTNFKKGLYWAVFPPTDYRDTEVVALVNLSYKKEYKGFGFDVIYIPKNVEFGYDDDTIEMVCPCPIPDLPVF